MSYIVWFRQYYFKMKRIKVTANCSTNVKLWLVCHVMWCYNVLLSHLTCAPVCFSLSPSVSVMDRFTFLSFSLSFELFLFPAAFLHLNALLCSELDDVDSFVFWFVLVFFFKEIKGMKKIKCKTKSAYFAYICWPWYLQTFALVLICFCIEECWITDQQRLLSLLVYLAFCVSLLFQAKRKQ